MVAEIINLQITPNPRYKDKFIVAMTPEEKAFNEATSVAFGIPLNLCTSIEQTRERIRNKMKEYSFPIWTLKKIIGEDSLKTDSKVIADLIDNYCGIANSNNIGGSKTDNSIALEIGALCICYVNVRLSPTFYGWVFGFGGDIRILAPSKAVEKIIDMSRRMITAESI